MDADKAKKLRLDNVLIKIGKRIQKDIIEDGDRKSYVTCPDDLFIEVRYYLARQGFNFERKSYHIVDIEGWKTTDTAYQYYVSI